VPEVEGGGRLVEQQHPRLLGEGPGQDRALLLPAGQGAQRPVGQAADLQPLHDVGDDATVRGTRSGQQRPVRGAAEEDVVAGGHRLRQDRQLRCVRGLAGALAPRHAAGRHAVDPHHPVVGVQAEHAAQQGRLAGAVGPDDRQPPAGFHGEPDAVEHAGAAVRGREPDDLDPGAGRGRCRHRRLAPTHSRPAKNGAPMNAVTTPMGSSAGARTTRATRSHSTRKAPPISSDAGRTR
jgi:hypothetical protein